MPRRVLATLLPVLAVGLTAVAALTTPAAAAPSSRAARLPAVHPTPQSMQAQGPAVRLDRRVALITGPDSDPAAVTAVRTVLSGAGVRSIDAAGSTAGLKHDETAVYVGGPDVLPAVADVVSGLNVQDAHALPAEGYVLVAGRAKGRPVVVLDGHDGTGTFYAAQTLRQLVERHGDTVTVPGVRVRDWPDQSVRGVIEGFYGTPWSDAQRLRQMDFYGAHKMNTYVYSPKDDAYLRAQWRDPYPPAQLDVLKTLVARATANHVEFTYALSPGLSVCYSSAADEQALVAKFQSLWDIGVRSFSIPLDDISYTAWNCDADKAKFGTGGGPAGVAQAYLLNEVQKDFIATHPGAQPLQMVPTEYSDVADSPYKTAIRTQLDPAVVVGWTGVGVVPGTITTKQATAARAVFGHQILLWDNYPVNDYATDRLLLGPYSGRDADLGSQLYGITANPMIEPEASTIALFGVADFTWNATHFDATASWQAALTELSGGNPQARQSLAAFADLEYYSVLNPQQAPALAQRIASFWSAWEAGDRAAAPLDAYLSIIQRLPSVLPATLNDPEFITEAKPWLDSAGAWGAAARAALRMLVAQRAGDGAGAVAARAEAEKQQAAARAFTYVGLGGTVNVTVGDGVIDTFVASALAENDRWLGVAGRHVTATTSLPTYQTYAPANMVDGDASTYFWSSGSPAAGDYVGIDLGTTRQISAVHIQAGDGASPNDYLHVATLEYSTDGTTWATAGSYANQATITATLPAGTAARYIRLRATQSDTSWVKVHEFAVTTADDETLTVSGAPTAAAGSTPADAADGDVDTSYAAASAPAAGDALVVTLPRSRPLARVAVVGTGRADVEVGRDGSWHRIGRLSASGYTELDAGGRTADAIRLSWTAGSATPRIAEVVPWYADTDPAGLTVTPPAIDATVGAASSTSVQITGTQPTSVSGTLRVDAPAGVDVRPARRQVTVGRGSQQSVPLTISAERAGTYAVPVIFQPRRGRNVSATVAVTVHPAVGSTDVALAAQGATAAASSVEDELPQFTADHAIDGDQSTRWSSDHTDDQWLQVTFAKPQHLGKLVLHWEAAHASSYRIETSPDGTTWTTARTVTNSPGGTETQWFDATDVAAVRVQGVARSTSFGYSLYELEAYPVQ